MNDITKEQQDKYIIEALVIAGFEENTDFPGIFRKEHGKDAIAVDLTAGQSVYFIIDKQKEDKDDDKGTLALISSIIVDAMDGKMPSQPTADMQYSKDAAPKPQTEVPTDTKDVPAVPEPAQDSTPTENKGNILDLIQKYVGNDVMQIFGDTGAGKSKFGLETARQAIAAGKTVYYLDTERNLTDEDVASLTGCTYKYTPVLDEIDKIVQKLPAVDVVILDSIGFPVLTTYARLSMKQKGDALLKLIAIFGDLKTWAYKNNGVAVVTNQPESEFNKEKGHIFRPFGDKSQFACKEIWKTKIKSRGATETNISIEAFRSRSVGFGTKIATMKITDAGVEVVT